MAEAKVPRLHLKLGPWSLVNGLIGHLADLGGNVMINTLLGALVGHIFGPSWPYLGASWGQVGPKMGPLGRVLGHVAAFWSPPGGSRKAS